MLISELTVYDFLKDKIKLSGSDAKRYAKEIALSGEKPNSKIEEQINTKFRESDHVTKSDLMTTKLELENRLSQLEVKIEKGFKEVMIWVIGFTLGIVGIAVAIIKLF